MSPEMHTYDGQIEARELENDSLSDVEGANKIVGVIRKFIRNKRFEFVKVVLEHNFPKGAANSFADAISDKREGSIKYKVLEDGDFQVTKVSFPEEDKESKTRPLNFRKLP